MGNKRLILRLSSLGDVILSSAVLSVRNEESSLSNASLNASWDWVVAEEFASVLEGHPAIQKLWRFDRQLGLKGWIELCRQIRDAQYDEIFDLHQTWRTGFMKVFLFGSALVSGSLKGRHFPKWRSSSKQRLRLYSYFFFKGLWPKALRPEHHLRRFTQAVGGSGSEKPDLSHLLKGVQPPVGLAGHENGLRYYCVMPSSQWEGKNWSVSSYVNFIEKIPDLTPVILGKESDRESVALCKELEKRSIRHISGVGKWSLSESAWALARAQAYLGSDTGLGHLAQAMGTRAVILYGPTTPDAGFGPWTSESQAVESSLACRPCGKDGRYCYRSEKYQCLRTLSPEAVVSMFRRVTQTVGSSC